MNFININDKNEEFKDCILFKEKEKNKIYNPEPCIFFDRDGVIIEDRHYINNDEDVKLCPGVKELLRHLYNKKSKIISQRVGKYFIKVC